MSFDWNASFEWFAEQFRQETGLMAPGKDDAMPSDMNERRKAWNEWMGIRSEQAWREWHERHGMLAASATPAERKQMFEQWAVGQGYDLTTCEAKGVLVNNGGTPLATFWDDRTEHAWRGWANRGATPAEGREAVDERAAWQTGEPPVKHGDADEFIVACRRAHNPSKIFVFSAHYANAYVDDNEDDEAKPRTGWFMHGMDMSGEYAYVYEKICDNGDEIIGWQPLPKWGDEARAALATTPTKDDIAQAAFDRGLKAGNEQAVAQQKCILELQSKLDAASAPTMSEGSPILLTVLLNLVNADTLLAHSAGFTDRYDAQALLRKAFDDAREILGIDRANAEGEKS